MANVGVILVDSRGGAGSVISAHIRNNGTHQIPIVNQVDSIHGTGMNIPLEEQLRITINIFEHGDWPSTTYTIFFYNLDVLGISGSELLNRFKRGKTGLQTDIEPLAFARWSNGGLDFFSADGTGSTIRYSGTEFPRTITGIDTVELSQIDFDSQQPIGDDRSWVDLKQEIRNEIEVVRNSECIPFEQKDDVIAAYEQIIEDFERNDIDFEQAQQRFDDLVATWGDQARCIDVKPNTCFNIQYPDGTIVAYRLRNSDFQTLQASIDPRVAIIDIEMCDGQPQQLTFVQEDIADRLAGGDGVGTGSGLGLALLIGLGGVAAALALSRKKK